jgi:sugar phosphate isomerase/epimerase
MGLELLLEKAPSLLSELDIYWACNFGAVDVPALLRRQAARTPLLHVKDGPLVQGQPHTPAGAGKMDIPAVIAAADESVLEWVIVELDECATDMTEAVGQSCKYLVGEGLAEGR